MDDSSKSVAQLQAFLLYSTDEEYADTNLYCDEIISYGSLNEDDFDETVFETLSEHLVLADQPLPVEKPAPDPAPASEPKPRSMIRKIEVPDAKEEADDKAHGKKRKLLNRAISLSSTLLNLELAKDTEMSNVTSGEGKVKITAEMDHKTKMKLRAKRFGLRVKMSDAERKEARKQRFGINSSVITVSSTLGTLTVNIDKLKKRAERFGQSVSKIMIDIENKEKLEKRKARFRAK